MAAGNKPQRMLPFWQGQNAMQASSHQPLSQEGVIARSA